MKGFLLGLLVAGLGFGGYFTWQHLLADIGVGQGHGR
jgi:hypothetical protein